MFCVFVKFTRQLYRTEIVYFSFNTFLSWSLLFLHSAYSSSPFSISPCNLFQFLSHYLIHTLRFENNSKRNYTHNYHFTNHNHTLNIYIFTHFYSIFQNRLWSPTTIKVKNIIIFFIFINSWLPLLAMVYRFQQNWYSLYREILKS